MTAITLRSMWTAINRSNAPIPAEGRVEDRYRVYEALIQHTQDDVDDDERSEYQKSSLDIAAWNAFALP